MTSPLPDPPPLRGRGEERAARLGTSARHRGSPSPPRGEGWGGAAKWLTAAALLSLACGVKGYPHPPRPDADPQPAAAATPAPVPTPAAPQCTSCAAPDGGPTPEPR